MNIEKEELTKSKAVLMFIFCLPMFILSLFPCYVLYRFFEDGRDMEKWVEVPAVINSAELATVATRTTHRPGSFGTHTFRIAASYTYYFQDRKFESDRVSILPISDNFFPSYHKKQVQLLLSSKDSGEPYRCFVDPRHPERSILFPKPPVYQVGIATLFALVFVTLGFGGTFVAVGYFFKKIIGLTENIAAKLYDAVLKIVMTVIAFLVVTPLTYFCYRQLREGASLYTAIWLVVPIYLIWSTFFFKKEKN